MKFSFRIIDFVYNDSPDTFGNGVMIREGRPTISLFLEILKLLTPDYHNRESC